MKFLVALVFVVVSVSAEILFHRELVVPVKTEGRITNGLTANPGQFPYQVGLWWMVNHVSFGWCGGSLIGKTWVLTAAHCLDGINTIKVYLGATERTAAQMVYTVDKSAIIIHPGFDSINLKNDISLIKIPAVSYSTLIKPIQLPAIASSYSTYVGDTVITSGWGRISDSISSVTDNLQWAAMTVITNSVCTETFGSSMVNASNICVSTPHNVSTCKGDSGGPLVDKSNVLIGVTSFGAIVGCEMGYPVAFTRVTSYLDWIMSATGISY